MTKYEIQKIEERNVGVQDTGTFSVGDGIALELTGDDNKIFLHANHDIVIRGGDGFFASGDLELSAGDSVVIDSGRFKFVSGEYKDHIILFGGVGSTCTAIELP